MHKKYGLKAVFPDMKMNKFLIGWFAFTLIYFFYQYYEQKSCPYVWHGGSPNNVFPGSCWCGTGNYCMCTPSLAIDAIIEIENAEFPSIVLVRRRDNPKDIYAIPGGFVNIGETVEHATIREAKEETNLDLVKLQQFHVYSSPERDKRRHTVSCVMRCYASRIDSLQRGDDAKAVEIIPISKVLSLELAFDHKTILKDYINQYYPNLLTKDKDNIVG